MKITSYTKYAGIVFIAIGILGFFPALLQTPKPLDPLLTIESFYGRLFGLFSVNSLHNLVHIGLGVWALFACREYKNSVLYCRITSVLYAVLAVFGLIPGLHTMFGMLPLFGHDVWLHTLIAAVTGYFGYVVASDPAQGFGGRQQTVGT